MGFIDETGAAQYYRDSRISAIHEGTIGIQANDLISRKIAKDHGASIQELINEMKETLEQYGNCTDTTLIAIGTALQEGVETLETGVRFIIEVFSRDQKQAYALTRASSSQNSRPHASTLITSLAMRRAWQILLPTDIMPYWPSWTRGISDRVAGSSMHSATLRGSSLLRFSAHQAPSPSGTVTFQETPPVCSVFSTVKHEPVARHT